MIKNGSERASRIKASTAAKRRKLAELVEVGMTAAFMTHLLVAVPAPE